MKHSLKHLQSLVAVALCVVMTMAFTSCSKDDDEPASDDLTSIVVGTWYWPDGSDDDIFVVNANGTGIGYENPSNYHNHKADYKFSWSYKDGWFNMNIDFYGEPQIEKMAARSVSKDKIVWERYDTEEGGDSSDYELWTWERYSK